MASRPARARGLKLLMFPLMRLDNKSRPARARGLKLETCALGGMMSMVAPRAGAWIET